MTLSSSPPGAFPELQDFFSRSPGGVPGTLVWNGERVTGHYEGMVLESAFQPLLDASTLRPVAHEALLRARDGQRSLPPPEALARAKTPADQMYLDRLCRTIHAINFAAQASPGARLFLNVDANHVKGLDRSHGQTFLRLLGYCGLDPSQIVLELLESDIADEERLIAAAESYQGYGFGIAIDDFGSRSSNFDRLWKLSPDIVKLDRGLIHQSLDHPRARRVLPQLIALLHDLNARVVCEGIETERQHEHVAQAGTDLVQGYWYARPAPDLAG
jgi:EAL domain-containing protein (putative c-di-GMP-specific phosphodiesterase class I)